MEIGLKGQPGSLNVRISRQYNCQSVYYNYQSVNYRLLTASDCKILVLNDS